MRSLLHIVTVILFSAALLAQGPGGVTTFQGMPPSQSQATNFFPQGATYGSPQGASGPLAVDGAWVTGAGWVRAGNDLVLTAYGEPLGRLVGYFDWRSQIDPNPLDDDTTKIPGGGCVDSGGNPFGWWKRW